MVDILYSGTRTAETILGGMFGASIYSFTNSGIPSGVDLALIVLLFVAAVVLHMTLHGWYEMQRGEQFE